MTAVCCVWPLEIVAPPVGQQAHLGRSFRYGCRLRLLMRRKRNFGRDGLMLA